MLSLTLLLLQAVLLNAMPYDGIPLAARERYADAVRKLGAQQYGPANDVLNQLAGEYPRLAEIFASRCSAQLGLQHWAAAEADCTYTLALKRLPTAVYGLAVAEDGQGKFGLAIGHYRQYSGLPDATAQLKAHALARADVLAQQSNAVAPPPPPPPAKKVATAEPQPQPIEAVATKPPPGGAKGEFVPGIPDPGEGLLYVYRNLVNGIGTGTTLFVDNKRIGELWNDHYFEVHLKPGRHTVTVKAMVPAGRKEPEHSLAIEVEDAVVTYVKLEATGGPGDVAFKPVGIGKEGRKEIR
ncbi:MAG: DUF2846 domain-containing protein, partial [Myxococcaceae bacterium]|nr:DUF2846 domain-containing protein [Myxococcaceae bacterium]